MIGYSGQPKGPSRHDRGNKISPSLSGHKFEKSADGTVMEDKIKFFTAVNKITEPVVLKVMITFLFRNSPQCTRASSLSRLHDHTQTHRTRQDSSGRVISPAQRILPDNIQHSQETDIHDTGGIRAHHPSKPAAADPRLRLLGQWDRLEVLLETYIWKMKLSEILVKLLYFAEVFVCVLSVSAGQ